MRCIHEMIEDQCAACSGVAVLTCRLCPQPLTDPMSVQLGVGPVCFGNDEPARRLFLERDLTKWWTVKMPEASARSWSQALKRIGLQAVVRSGELYYSGPDVAAEQS